MVLPSADMAMNRIHRKLCSSDKWAQMVEDQLLPWSLGGVELGENVLEIGPGYGANLRVLVNQVPSLTALEINPDLVDGLRREFDGRAEVMQGDGTAMPLPDNEFSSVVCFTMVHHIPTTGGQDALFAEALRVLRPGGTFAGSDGVARFKLRMLHFGDVYNPLPPNTLPDRLAAVGFTDIYTSTKDGSRQRWSARKPEYGK
jgi:SAM-dependent methyltransferase